LLPSLRRGKQNSVFENRNKDRGATYGIGGEKIHIIETLQMKSITRRIDDREPNSGIPEIQRKRIRELNET
jgi:hypothetical protein